MFGNKELQPTVAGRQPAELAVDLEVVPRPPNMQKLLCFSPPVLFSIGPFNMHMDQNQES